MKTTAYYVIAAIVSYVFSYGIFVPSDLRQFTLLAIVGTMCGIKIAALWNGSLRSRRARSFAIGIDALAFTVSLFCYIFAIQGGSANRSDIVVLGLLLFIIFFSFAAVFPLTGVTPDGLPGERGPPA